MKRGTPPKKWSDFNEIIPWNSAYQRTLVAYRSFNLFQFQFQKLLRGTQTIISSFHLFDSLIRKKKTSHWKHYYPLVSKQWVHTTISINTLLSLVGIAGTWAPCPQLFKEGRPAYIQKCRNLNFLPETRSQMRTFLCSCLFSPGVIVLNQWS